MTLFGINSLGAGAPCFHAMTEEEENMAKPRVLYCRLLTPIDRVDGRNIKTTAFYMHVALNELDFLSRVFKDAGASHLGRFIRKGEGREEVILAWDTIPIQHANYDRELHLSFDQYDGYKLQEGPRKRFFPFMKGPAFVEELIAFLGISH